MTIRTKRVKTGQNLIIVTLTAPDEIEAGGTIRFSAFFLSLKDGAFNPTGLQAKIYEGVQRATTLSTITPTQDDKGVGSYFADYIVPTNQGTGPLAVMWTGIYQQSDQSVPMSIQATQIFRVINPPTWV
ncbi:MAG: hypothetical protein ACREBQ_09180 [Nitrososphaerales archaeon]